MSFSGNIFMYYAETPSACLIFIFCQLIKRSNARKRRSQREIIFPVKDAERDQHGAYGREPENDLVFGKTPQRIFKLHHKFLPKQNKHPSAHLQRPNDVQTNALHSFLPGGRLIILIITHFFLKCNTLFEVRP